VDVTEAEWKTYAKELIQENARLQSLEDTHQRHYLESDKEIARQCEVIATLKEELDWMSREWDKDVKKLIKFEHSSF
jgi:isopentenyl diphosphate isomerase/L-lactate dehydrogenase-like FMN-dependent dehydrogenase